MSKTIAMYLTNRTATLVQPYNKADIEPFVSFYPPGFRYMKTFRMGGWSGKITLLKRDKMPSGLFRAIKQDLTEKLGLKFDIEYRRQSVEFKPTGIVSDRAYQNECVEAMVTAAGKGGGLILAATGVGKTYLTAQFFSRLVGHACFIVDELTLLKQAQDELSQILNEKVGQVGDSIFEPERITVATVQTMHLHQNDERFLEWTKQLDVIIIDEIHVALNKRNWETVQNIEPPAVYGLTATLELKRKHVRLKAYSVAGPVLYEYPLIKGTEEGYLTPAVVTRLRYLNPCGSYGDYSKEYTEQIVENTERNKLIVDVIEEAYARKKHIIVLVERIAHLQALSDLCTHIPHRVVCGLKSVEDRVLAKQKFEEGKVRLILANKVFQKGVNIIKIDVIVDATGMKSKNAAVQKLGRGLRLCEGKTGLLYFDISDEGGEKHCDKNRFYTAAKSRARALKAAGVSTERQKGPFIGKWASAVFDRAELRLKTLGGT